MVVRNLSSVGDCDILGLRNTDLGEEGLQLPGKPGTLQPHFLCLRELLCERTNFVRFGLITNLQMPGPYCVLGKTEEQ